ncbi:MULTISPECIES: 3-isopropylmalate dehydratase large subunit [unclassified Marinobacter]|jgi:3-isopropylmalate/(R)-2-methylmalate dehydratase large subunit|uniref:3-isopropylmalate dehydratase large subunit n=1 Tax=unclassified Marinobacter TaxID=83889 RepID=UPI00200F50FA|nr:MULTISPECIES: 3-isopropylmalate dehydratase large subunit [unclassified Marinobacter]MCL1479641.1 3-isopropylmalate dehydratase large subunit [Marinobacter sp.]MCL1485223.1 3-isopropylmalate dehydratase large subunit [Marinobacter sp.]UQG55023.1 3-isopropylmalate dehydratase large subunit [Marinobacter sp. M4C]UQG63824.1 3-isopropylmalate dehydratase large subunit [Marinobacter sp. M2C]UQG68107.1 3-isopropylmalate dehydratase large subunit [Marinobacter sp. M1C]
MASQTLYNKLWDRHLVAELADGSALLYVDRHLLHEVTSPQAFSGLRSAGRKPWRIGPNVAVPDHAVPTRWRELGVAGIADRVARIQVETLTDNCREFGIPLIELEDERQGIVHVVGPEQGLTLPGMTIVCGDSHTATHGAFATLAMGIGTSDVEHVLASQTLRTHRQKNMRVVFDGTLGFGVTPKDLILALIGRIGTAGGTGYAIEYAGETIRNMSMEGRMTVCNMSIEAGARAGMIAYDAVTEAYVRGRPHAPEGTEYADACRYWQTLHSDDYAVFDRDEHFPVSALVPQITWGTSPEMVVGIDGCVPESAGSDEATRASFKRTLDYMGLEPGQALKGLPVDKVFIGSCTNARMEDLRAVANLVKGQKVSRSIAQALIVPGSGQIRLQAEREGLDAIFQKAGFEWRSAGCSMCLGMNDDRLQAGERCASTSNRNFEGRQGKGGRTHLMSPLMAAAAALTGKLTDVREL